MPISKSAIDATRFTPTTPHASAKHPPKTSTTAPPNGAAQRRPGPPGETPQQKVHRLREAAARARDAKISGFDKAIAGGRVWADRAHRFTALTLIGFTGIAGIITVYAVGDMIIHNRRKRREFYLEQAAQHSTAVYEARNALRYGTATDEQLALIENEEVKTRADAKRERERLEAKGKGILATVKGYLFEGLKSDENQVTREGDAVEEQADGKGQAHNEHRIGGLEAGVLGRTGESAILKAVEEKKAEAVERMEKGARSATEHEQQGGVLDRLGTEMVVEGLNSSKSHTKRGDGWTLFSRR